MITTKIAEMAPIGKKQHAALIYFEIISIASTAALISTSTNMLHINDTNPPIIAANKSPWIYTKKVDKYDKIEDRQRRQKNDRKEKQ